MSAITIFDVNSFNNIQSAFTSLQSNNSNDDPYLETATSRISGLHDCMGVSLHVTDVVEWWLIGKLVRLFFMTLFVYLFVIVTVYMSVRFLCCIYLSVCFYMLIYLTDY